MEMILAEAITEDKVINQKLTFLVRKQRQNIFYLRDWNKSSISKELFGEFKQRGFCL
jgi:hypothetical protein